MARRTHSAAPAKFTERIVDIDVQSEMQESFLEYAYSVIYSRALPDARDGLKPVQRRILYSMNELGLRPDRGHVKSSRVVGEVMGKYHPHGDTAIYDALVRMAQPFSLRLPLVDGHGNFGSADDGPAAMRYTEARLASSALLMTSSLDESTVDFVPNYDDQLLQPEVLPAAYPNLLVNGASGIAVGMATNMAPHNLGEVIAAARYLLESPQANLDDLMRFIPGPDLPTGGRIVGLDGIREAYETGRGTFKTRATVAIEQVSARRQGLVITELPYLVGPERVRERIVDLARAKKITGIADVVDLTDREHGLRLVIEIKNGFNPEAVLQQLYKLTPMEDSFGINNVALVDGQPRTLGLLELLRVYVDFRLDVLRRRTTHRLTRAEKRLHLVEGLLRAIVDIDRVIAIIRASDDADEARTELISAFALSAEQAEYILELRLRRLTKFSRLELDTEAAALRAEIAALTAILADESTLRQVASSELAAVAAEHATERRTVLLAGAETVPAAAPLEVADDPCWVVLSSTGLLARMSSPPRNLEGRRAAHDAVRSVVAATARGQIALVTTQGRALRVPVLEIPAAAQAEGTINLAAGAPIAVFADLPATEQVVAVMGLDPEQPGLALGTARGIVKRLAPDFPTGRDDWEVIGLKDGDYVVGAADLRTGSEQLCFITSDAQLLHFSADSVRPQGRAAGGVAGMKLAEAAQVMWFGAVTEDPEVVVVTLAGSASALPGTDLGSVKISAWSQFPSKGRATGGVRAHRFLRGEDRLLLAWVGPGPVQASGAQGKAVPLPTDRGKRDGSGLALTQVITAISSAHPSD